MANGTYVENGQLLCNLLRIQFGNRISLLASDIITDKRIKFDDFDTAEQFVSVMESCPFICRFEPLSVFLNCSYFISDDFITVTGGAILKPLASRAVACYIIKSHDGKVIAVDRITNKPVNINFSDSKFHDDYSRFMMSAMNHEADFGLNGSNEVIIASSYFRYAQDCIYVKDNASFVFGARTIVYDRLASIS